MTFTILEAAAEAARQVKAHQAADGCTTCHDGARLAELCPAGQHAAATVLAPGLLEPECAHGSWEVTSEYPARDGDGWVKSRRCADCGDSLDPLTEAAPHWPAAAVPDNPPPAERTPEAAPGPARLAALMRARQHWRDGRLVSEGTISQAEIRDALGWEEPADAPAVPWEPGRQAKVRQLVRVITAGPAAFPEMTDEWLIRTAREILPELLDVVERLAARVEDLEGHGCRCYDPTSHVPGCVKAAVRWRGRTYPAAVWYRDQDGDWWVPVSVDSRGCLVLLCDGDHSNEPVPLDRLEAEYGPMTATAYGAHVRRGDLPEHPSESAAALRAHLRTCPDCQPEHNPDQRCRTGRELTRAATGGSRG
ncbi:hypothetical protein [Streptomyces sp. NPDC006355]|uniref:hypothetical protein n=1 Tax=Streptomyces sp. NPDC006355 TaxID=3156758 RepID=UPI0033B4AEE0